MVKTTLRVYGGLPGSAKSRQEQTVGRKTCRRAEDHLTYNWMVVDQMGGGIGIVDGGTEMDGLIEKDADTDRLLRALADPTRRAIVVRAMAGDHSVSDLARHHPMSFAAIQKHVAVLEEAGLVTKERRGRRHLVRTNIEAVRTARMALDRLEELWRQRMDRFETVLAAEAETEGGDE